MNKIIRVLNKPQANLKINKKNMIKNDKKIKDVFTKMDKKNIIDVDDSKLFDFACKNG